jgi:hypothetical protein
MLTELHSSELSYILSWLQDYRSIRLTCRTMNVFLKQHPSVCTKSDDVHTRTFTEGLPEVRGTPYYTTDERRTIPAEFFEEINIFRAGETRQIVLSQPYALTSISSIIIYNICDVLSIEFMISLP